MSTRPAAVTLTLVGLGLFAVLSSSCARKPPLGARRPVRLEGAGFAMPAPVHSYPYFLPDSIGSGCTAFLREGDLLNLIRKRDDWEDPAFDDFLLPYYESDGSLLRFERDSFRLFMNGVLVGLDLSDDAAVWDWVRQAKPEELKGLRSILADFPPDSHDGDLVLGKIAAVAPHVGLQGTLSPALVGLFEPQTIVTWSDNVLQNIALDNPACLSHVENLVLNSPGTLDCLLHMPRLRNLMLYEWDSQGHPLPGPIENLEMLFAYHSDNNPGISYLAGCKNLRELVLAFSDSLSVDWAPLASLQHLEMLILTGETPWDPGDLPAAPRLRWLGIGVFVTQTAFETLLRHTPNLEILSLALSSEDEIVDYAPIAELGRLSGLSFRCLDTAELSRDNLSIVATMDRLRLFQITAYKDNIETATAMAAIVRQGLPECDVSVVGYCLGSGWILLLIPLLFGFYSLEKRLAGAKSRAPSAKP